MQPKINDVILSEAKDPPVSLCGGLTLRLKTQFSKLKTRIFESF